MPANDPYRILGISPESGDQEIRAAYLRKVKEFPPDRAPRDFEQVRDAYETLRDPRARARLLLLSVDPEQPLSTLIADHPAERVFTGPEPWLAVLRENQT
jgi:curved DNA-binding protein CbpA